MAKNLKGFIKLQIVAGAATPARPIGPALGMRGLNISAFCKEFNAATQEIKGQVVPVVISYYSDKSFTFEVKAPTVSFLLKQAAGLDLKTKPGSGSKTPGRSFVGTVTSEQIREIAARKMQDMNAADINGALHMVKGSADSIGIKVLSE